MRRAAAGATALVLACAAALSGCAGSDDRPAASGKPSVIASTDVWGSVASAVAGPDATVTSVVTGSVDPHSYSPPASTAAAIEDAALVVYNGGGYDAWVSEVLATTPGTASVDAYSLLDAAALGQPAPPNEHVFYELNTVKAVAERIAERLAEADPANGAEYRSRATQFARRADGVLASEHELAQRSVATAVVATEPVAHYLLLAAGVKDKTPPGFTNAVEQDSDPSPADMATVLDLITTGEVAALVFNDQTVTGATARIRDAARSAGVPVVAVTETLPAGTDYITWQTDTVERLAAALGPKR